ncbi:hypothetical protein ACLI09_01800 [Flavobacterium sp. RHBU_24]|uniref:hypothetical protein n=1 Tax=Flavobacterium sp. RHBU_24 TaxID=3391185 RepID=UPI0039855FF0
MNVTDLTNEDLKLIKESLEYTRLKFESYEKYPSVEFKNQRVNDVVEVIKKIDLLINQ